VLKPRSEEGNKQDQNRNQNRIEMKMDDEVQTKLNM
jgi:hypothetical protein